MNDTAPAAEPTCRDCGLRYGAHPNGGAIYIQARYIGGKPVLYCGGFRTTITGS